MNFYLLRKSVLILIIALRIGNVFGRNYPEVDDKSKNNQDDLHSTRSTSSAVFQDKDGLKIINCIIRSKLKRHQYRDDFSVFVYFLERRHWFWMRYPNKLEYIEFGHERIIFNDDTNLPVSGICSFMVLTCVHKVPVLIRYLTPNGYIFYSKNPKTGKWVYHTMRGLNHMEEADANGVKTYKVTTHKEDDDMIKALLRTCKGKCKKLCKDHALMPRAKDGEMPDELIIKLISHEYIDEVVHLRADAFSYVY